MKYRTPATERMSAFAEKYRLRLADTGAERVVLGKFGELADMDDSIHLRFRLLAVPRNAVMNKALLSRRRKALAGGMVAKWRGDAETILFFNPSDEAQAALAIQLVGAKRRRSVNLTPERKAELRARLAAVRASRAVQNAAQDTPLLSLSMG